MATGLLEGFSGAFVGRQIPLADVRWSS